MIHRSVNGSGACVARGLARPPTQRFDKCMAIKVRAARDKNAARKHRSSPAERRRSTHA